MRRTFSLIFCALIAFQTFSQELSSFKKLELKDLSSFREQAGNWMIVGNVTMDPNVDIHHKEEPTEKKKRKKSKEEPPKAVTFQEGTGILLNMNDEEKKDALITNWEHGDIELELEVMIPKGSNSGIYLQGRYELQLLDSWGVKDPAYSDIGGIYRNWETDPDKIYMGKAPLTNAAKAPGLWQKIKLHFKAPRFDENGNKVANAKFVYVDLNGVRIHDNLEVPKHTGGPLDKNEVKEGPLMIQGDHGPVALRNIRYKFLYEPEINIKDVEFKSYNGEFTSIDDFYGKEPDNSGSGRLSALVSGREDNFGIVYNSHLNIKDAGKYEITLTYNGGARLKIGEETLINYPNPDQGNAKRSVTVDLDKGDTPFEIVYLKKAPWMPARLGFFVKGENTYPKALHAFDSYPPDQNNVSKILVETGNEPRLLRAFLDYNGDRSKRLTHTIAVGEPSGVNYIYDLKNGNMACVWRGDFVDATPMWHSRGDGSYKPIGAVEFLINNQELAYMSESKDFFPEKSDKNEWKGKGYAIDESTGRPVFKYEYKGIAVKDQIDPAANGKTIMRKVEFENIQNSEGLFFKLAEGSKIEKMADGSYAIDDKRYFLKVIQGNGASVREANGLQELIIPVSSGAIQYSVIW